MAIITGQVKVVTHNHHVVAFYDAFSDTLHGTSGDDVIKGLGGNDDIYGGRGDDLILGGKGDDVIFADDGGLQYSYWGRDTVGGGEGNDDINFKNTSADVQLFGDEGNDRLHGGSGNDFLDGGADADTIKGGAGNDTIKGGTGRDDMWGGSGGDTFIFDSSSDSGLNSTTADRIHDFETGRDHIVWAVGTAVGDSESYGEVRSPFQGIDASLKIVEAHLSGKVFAFVTDGTDGYLFADTHHSGHFDSGVILNGLSTLGSFTGHDIIPG